jgi:hypothetical protein
MAAPKLPARPARLVLPRIVDRGTRNQSGRNFHRRGNLVVLHDPEGSYASAIATCQRAGSQVSYHAIYNGLLGRDAEVAQLVGWHRKAWHAAAFNDESIGLCIAGFYLPAALGPRSTPKGRAPLPPAALWTFARITGYVLKSNGIRAVWNRTPWDGKGGFCRHADLGARGTGGQGRRDPMDAGPFAIFARMVQAEVRRGGYRAPDSWGIAA